MGYKDLGKKRMPPTVAQPSRVASTNAAVNELVQERERARAFEAELKARDKSLEEMKVSVAKLTEQVQLTDGEKKSLAAERARDRVKYELRASAVKHGAHNEDQVYKLLHDELSIAEDGRIVSSADPKIDIDAHVKSFLDTNVHLQKPRTASGSGASPTPGSAPQAHRAPSNHDMTTREGATAAFHERAREWFAANTTTKQ